MHLTKKYLIIIVLLIGILGLGYFYIQDHPTKIIKQGDTVSVDYVGTLENGEIFDTNILEEAKKTKFYDEKRSYTPLTFKIGNHEVVTGFEEAVLGMKKGQIKEVTLPPEKAYGSVNPTLLLKNFQRETTVPRYQILSKTTFKQIFKKEAQVGDILSKEGTPWKIKVTNLNESSVEVESLAQVGDIITLPSFSWKITIIKITNKDITLFQNPQTGDTVILPYKNKILHGKVTDITNTTYSVDLNHPLAGKSLTFKITVKNINP